MRIAALLSLILPVTQGGLFRRVQPKISKPSGPVNVTLDVVSRTELGVTWEPPLFDGGKTITKYLVEWDTDKYMNSGIASPSNPYGNAILRSEVVSGENEFRIAGLEEGQKYYVRVSAYGEGYSHAISSVPPYAVPTGMLPGYLTDVSLAVASDSDTADRLRLAWSAPEVDVNGFSVLPSGCAGGESPPSAPDSMESYRVMWDTHPSFSNALVYDVPAVVGDGSPLQCCPSSVSDDGVCHIELGTEVQSFKIEYPQSSVPASGELFDSGAARIAYVGSQSKSIQVETPMHGSMEVQISPSASLPLSSPISVNDLIRIEGNVYLVSNVDSWPGSINIASEYVAPASHSQPATIQAYFATPPSTCFDLSSMGNSAENLRSHISQNFDDSPFDESITVSRSTLMKPFASGGSIETRVVGYEYHVTFSGQGFSSTLGSQVEELVVISDPSSSFSTVGGCGVPFVSDGVDVSSKTRTQLSTKMDSESITPGETYYARVAGVNDNGVGPFVPAIPEAEVPRSQPGLAQNCQVHAMPTVSSSLKVEWNGVHPYHGQAPSTYKVEFYDFDSGASTPIATEQITDIDESTRYSITKDGLTPGMRYKVLIVPANELGEGGPSWFSEFNPAGLIHDNQYDNPQDYLEKSCHAVPICESGSVECDEVDASNFAIVARSIPPPPEIEVGTYPSVVGTNWFTEDSVFLTFESPLSGTGVPTDKFLIEWSTMSSFLPLADEGMDSLWSTEVIAQYSDVNGENAVGELLIDSLGMGMQYFVRVSAHNTAGYGSPSNSVPVKPMTRPDPPFEPMLSSLSSEQLTLYSGSSLTDSAVMGTSLLVSWQPPKVDATNDRPDLVGDGGDDVTKYLVEWSRISWDNYSPTVFEINLQTSAGVGGSGAAGILSGSFQLLVDTTISSDVAASGPYITAAIPVDVSSAMLKTVLENVPNVGEVEVASPQPLTWRLTFISEVGDIDMTLQENNVLDDTLAAGNVDITKVGAGTIPTNAVYGSEETSSTNYIIAQLVPGMKIFVRVSASNQVGFGPRRKTAPEFSSPQLQRPDYPTSLYSDDMPPYLSVFSPIALKVHIGPPFYDGGSPLTSFFIEWDFSPTFDSSALGDGSSLGSTRVDAATQVCSSCVNNFDLTTNTFTYSGSAVTAELLVSQRKIMVHFDDDAESYLFTVLSATSSTIIVSSQHLRVTSHNSMRDQDGGLGGNLDILGTTYVIDGLDTGRAYYVRVSSENGEMGTGKSVATIPPNKTPRGFPLSPSTSSVSVVDKNSLRVSWSSDAQLNDPNIQAYKIERFRKSDAASDSTFSFFGEQEVVELSTVGLGLVGGTFHLYFGGLDASTDVFLGTAKATNGLSYVETQADLSPHLHRGELILIGSDQYAVHETNAFASNILPISDAYSGSDAEAISIYARSKSMPISYDATEEEVRNALEQMPNVNHVNVRREVDVSDGHHWILTFMTNIGPQPMFSVGTSKLIGTNPLGFTITRSVVGIAPDDYYVTMVQDPTVTSIDMDNLITGQEYYIRVSAAADKGDSLPVDSLLMPIAPGGVPGEVSPPSIRPLDDSNIVVTFEANAESNGAPVEGYIIEASSDSSFAVGTTSLTLEPDHRVQRITTKAHSIPWGESASFTLSLGDFHGDFTVPVGQGTTTVRVQNGDNVLERSTGTLSLSSTVARGDFLSVGGIEFRVCLSDSHLYDETHLTLCSKDNALDEENFHVDSPLSVIDELPIFILDTSLGAAKSPAVGDIFLRTVDASGNPIDARVKLRRGDLIRVGHPQLGQTFRVSSDSGRDFTDKVIPLGSVEDAYTPASLSSESLEHSTYEVQSFFIRSSSDSATLTPSNTLSSGFRIRYKTETTESTTSGGANGCLKWDADAIDVKTELERLVGIDSVFVTKEELSPILGGLGAGVKYYVTFTGLNVRGNIPALQIVDVGSNGCLDAHSLGGTFGEDIAPIAIEQVETPYVPIYEIQTTSYDIPYDASAADVKAALEDLSLSCTVDVTRTINRHGYSWDVTFEGKDAIHLRPLLPLSANGANLLADVDPGVTVVDVARVGVPADLGGTPYFVRVAALNSFGMGPFIMSNPRAIEVSPQPPSGPVDVYAEPISDTEILVQWNPPVSNGGRPVTHYKIEYDELSSFSGGQNSGSISLSSSSISSISDVQSITVRIDNGGLPNVEAYLSGTFSLSFDGQKTGQLPYNAPPQEVKASLEELCNIDEVQVTRSIHCSPDPSIGCMTPEGYTWIVTFVSVFGDQHHRPTSKLSSRTSHKLSIDGAYLFECSDVTRTLCNIGGSTVASVGTAQEVQSITVASSPFSVTVLGETSDVVSIGDSIADIEEKLNSYLKNGLGKISVSCPGCVGGAIASGDTILLNFLSFRGDLPPVSVSDPAAIVSEVTKGRSQFVVGRATYSTVIPGLTSVHDWNVRVFAYNGAGEGPPELVWPSPLRLTAVAPQVPENVGVIVQSATSLQVSWDRPNSIGGAQLSSFVVEYDTTLAFATQNGMPLGQLLVAEADADASIGVVVSSYPDSSDPILRKRIMINDADVISQGVISVGLALLIDGQVLTVLVINEDSCGVTCLTMDEDYTGATSSGMKIYSGAEAKHYNVEIEGLIPGVDYFLRVAAVNEKSVSSFSFPPVSAAPMDVPNALSWAKMTSGVDSDELRLGYGPPLLSDKPYGANGSPTSQYHVEIATAESHRPQIISLSTKADTSVSGYIEISVGYQGDFDMLISLANQPAQLMVDPGSRWVDTMGGDLTSILHPGETIMIEEEYVEVHTVLADKIELTEHHIHGTNGATVSGYRMNNYIGSATLSPGDSTFVEANGQSLESVLRPGEVFEVTNDAGEKEYLTAMSVTGSSVSFSPSFSGNTITTTPIYAKKKVIVSANSSSGVMRASVEALRDVGSVEVERDGPNSSEGFSHYLTFSSNMGTLSCSVPSWCFAAGTVTVSYISVGNAGDCDGNYVQISFHDGRPKYELLGKSCFLLHDTSTSEWKLYSSSGSVLSSLVSSVISPPFGGWSNSVSVAASSGAIPLLVGQGAVAKVTVLQGGVEQPFSIGNTVYSTDIDVGQLDVQEVALLSDEHDLRGSFELSLGTIPQKIIVYHDESVDDFKTKLESLSGIGHVRVDSTTTSTGKFGRIWTITFLRSGDVPLLQHYGISNLQGTGVSLNVREVAKGSIGPHHITVDGLQEGGVYAARIQAKNEVGVGAYTTASQPFGGGIHPMTVSVSSAPGAPLLSSGVVTKDQADIKFSVPSSSGSDITSYKFEWTTSSDFGASSEANARVYCSDASEILGSFRFIYGNVNLSQNEASIPIDVRSSVDEVTQALSLFRLLNEIEVSVVTNELSEIEWDLKFLHDAGPRGTLSLDTENLGCQSEAPRAGSSVTMTIEGSMPADYGTKEVFADELTCGSIHLAEFSDVQYVTLIAGSSAVTSGSYQLMLDGEATDCIPTDATATQMKDALEDLAYAGMVDVVAIAAPVDSHFPQEYKITFTGNYAYGDWPALQINLAHFGAGECDVFVGGADHRASILPLRDEAYCLDGAPKTVAIVIDSITPVGGTFAISFGGSLVDVGVEMSASDMKDILTGLIGTDDVQVTKHYHDDMGEGVAWAVTFPRTDNDDNDQIRVVDTFVTGRNAKVDVYPVLTVKTFSPEDDSSGNFRLIVDGEITAPLSHQASQKKVLQEMHRLNGIGKVNMLGPVVGENLSSLEFNALVDNSFIIDAQKAIAIVGDLTSTLAEGDPLILGTCELEIKNVVHEDFDDTQSAGLLYETLYAASPETANAKTLGYTILQIRSVGGALSFSTDCSQSDGAGESVNIGAILKGGDGVNHDMIFKSYTTNLDHIEVKPERNWRGTSPRIFFKSPFGMAPQTFTLTGIDHEKLFVRASSRNSQGYGLPSSPLALQFSATVPDAPSYVELLVDA